MASIKEITRSVARTLSEELYEAASSIAKKYGLKAKRKSGRFDSLCHTAKVEFVVEETVDGKSPERKKFEELGLMYGLKPEMYGKTISIKGETYTIDGLRPRASKKKILLNRTSDNKKFVTTIDMIKQKLHITENC